MNDQELYTREPNFVAPTKAQYARDLQALLYREIGISAVAAALFACNEMGQAPAAPSEFDRDRLESLPAVLRADRAA